MQLNKKVLPAINKNAIRLRLALELGVSENTIRLYINTNSENLTKAAALKIIREATGLSDNEILIESKVKAQV